MNASTPETPGPRPDGPPQGPLAIGRAIASLPALVFPVIDGSIENYRCRFWDFVTFQCNRWDAREKPWE